jgi:hypothetical protein
MDVSGIRGFNQPKVRNLNLNGNNNSSQNEGGPIASNNLNNLNDTARSNDTAFAAFGLFDSLLGLSLR